MRPVSALVTFIVVLTCISNCHAQRHRLFKRAVSNGQASSPMALMQQVKPQHIQQQPIEIGRYSNYRNPFVSRLLDGPTTPGRRNPYEVESRYVGGIHRSYFNNIGLPSGDIGIRGNALNWDTWNW